MSTTMLRAGSQPQEAAIHLLVVEDDAATRRMLTGYFHRIGYGVTAVADAEAAIEESTKASFDVALVDVVLPGESGWSLISQLRLINADLPILFLTAMAALEDELRGLGLGADDYLRKPVDPKVLKARVEAVLARSGRTGKRAYPGIVIDFSSRGVMVDGNPVRLSHREFDLLSVLAAQPKRVFSRNDLIDRVWDSDYEGSERGVDTRVNSLRRKLGDTGRKPRFVGAVRGIGYRFVASDTSG
jgi:two-component system alkaline phosphatase synthesis response regulator PhoP